MDTTTKMLFFRFPREVANPKRWVVNNEKEFMDFIFKNNGVSDCYTSVYPLNGLVDKLPFDNDYGYDLDKDNNIVFENCFTLGETKKMYRWMLDEDYQVVPVVSAKKGYHLYFITKPKLYGKDTKLLATKASFSIIKSVFGKFRQTVKRIGGKDVRVFMIPIGDKWKIIAPDPSVCGDTQRIMRIPQTLRPPENISYCTYLPPYEFLDMSEEDVVEHIKTRHTYDYHIDFNKAPLLTDFEFDFNDFKAVKGNSLSFSDNEEVTIKPNFFLKGLLRPCLYRHMITDHPNHYVRVAATYDLLYAGYNSKEILSVYEKLGWEDFMPNYCFDQIESCRREVEGGYKSYSCSKLRFYGIPKYCCEVVEC